MNNQCNIPVRISCILAFLLSLWLNDIHAQSFTFNHITKREGLDSEFLDPILKDSKGYIWIGSNIGLIRYNGRNFQRYSYSYNNASSISNNNISGLFEDTNGNLWIGTHYGLSTFNPSIGSFIRLYHNPDDSTSISGNEITTVYQDRHGTIWVGTGNGLNRLDQSQIRFRRYMSFVEYPKRNVRPRITGFVQDLRDDDLYWLCGDQGFGAFRSSNGSFTPYMVQEEKSLAANLHPKNLFLSLYQDKDGIIWLGNHYGELTRFDPVTKSIAVISVEESSSLGFPNIEQIFQFDSVNLWLSGNFDGIRVFNKNTRQVTSIRHDPSDPSSLQPGRINAIYRDNEGIIWLTQNRSVSKLDPYLQYFDNWNSEKAAAEQVHTITAIAVVDENLYIATQVPYALHVLNTSAHQTNPILIPERFKLSPRGSNEDIVKRIYYDKDSQTIWMGTSSDVLLYHIPTSSFRHITDQYDIPPKNEYFVNRIFKDSDGNFWIAYYYDGLIRLNPRTKEVTDFTKAITEPVRATQKLKLYDITEDKNGRIWIATHAGIRIINKVTGAVIRVKDYLADASVLVTLKTLCLASDSQDRIWIGSLGNGLFRVDFNEDQPILNAGFGMQEGLCDNNITKLFIDKEDNIWATTHAGMVWISPMGGVENFKVIDGIPEEHLGDYSIVQITAGDLILAGNSSLLFFSPSRFPKKNIEPPVNIDHLFILKKDTILTLRQPGRSPLELGHNENDISISFSVLNYSKPEESSFKYILEGQQDFWISTNSNNVSYANLEPGTYVFRVKASNQDDVWNEEGASLTITILPPPWKTWWAYSLYAIAFLTLLAAARNEIIKRERLKNRMKLKELEADKLHELDTLKSRFFANISHEFRTPLTLILGPIEKQLGKTQNTEDKQELTLVQRNASRLLNLVNQLLDLSRIEAGSMKLHCRPGSLREFVQSVASQFQSMAASKEIEFTIGVEEDVVCMFDPDKLDRVLFNLLSNAFKFVPKHGKIELRLTSGVPDDKFEEGCAQIEVADTGPGIAVEHLEKIFDRFYQVDASFTREHEGSGLGLALVKELVELHHGTITVESHPGEGAKFIVRLPLGSVHLLADEIDATTPVQKVRKAEHAIEQNQEELTPDPLQTEHSHPRVLVVEDNDDLRYYIRESLRKEYTLLLAKNGQEGADLALEEIPDLIVSDLMMPALDGLQLCEQLKSDERTSHIPIILLTAKADQSAKIEGYETGADDYIAKPFDMTELRARISNLIESRKKLIEKFSGKIALRPSDIKAESVDDRFIKKVLETIEAHMHDTSFGVEALAREVGMSSAQLYRKLKALTNYKPVDLIRHIRLERAASLLKQHAGNVAEVAYKVGFNNLSYFAKVFREKYGVTPSEFTNNS